MDASCVSSALQVLLDGEPFLDLHGMLRYRNDGINGVNGNNGSSGSNNSSSGSNSNIDAKNEGSGDQKADDKKGDKKGTDSRMSHLDVPGSPARGALDRIGGIGVGSGGDTRSVLRQAIVHMTQRNPRSRLSVQEYRQQLEASRPSTSSGGRPIIDSSGRPTAGSGSGSSSSGSSSSGRLIADSIAPFPSYFSSALYPLFMRLHWEGVGPDLRIAIMCEVRTRHRLHWSTDIVCACSCVCV